MSARELDAQSLACLAAWVIEGYVAEELHDVAYSAVVNWVRRITDDDTITAVSWEDNHDIRFGVMQEIEEVADVRDRKALERLAAHNEDRRDERGDAT